MGRSALISLPGALTLRPSTDILRTSPIFTTNKPWLNRAIHYSIEIHPTRVEFLETLGKKSTRGRGRGGTSRSKPMGENLAVEPVQRIPNVTETTESGVHLQWFGQVST